MADIDVVPKRHMNAWLWIVLAIIVAAVVIWAVEGRRRVTTQLQPSGVAPVAASSSAGELHFAS